MAVLPGPPAVLVAAAVLVGATRGAATLLQATLVADIWGMTRYATLAGIFAAPITFCCRGRPVGRDRLAGSLGSCQAMFIVLSVLVGTAAAIGGVRPMMPEGSLTRGR